MRTIIAPELPPGVCCITARGDGVLIDSERQDNYGNRLYVHEEFIREAAALIGCLAPAEAEKLRAEVGVHAAANAELELIATDYELLRKAIGVLLQHGGTLDSKGRYQLPGISADERVRLAVLTVDQPELEGMPA